VPSRILLINLDIFLSYNFNIRFDFILALYFIFAF
jgi:hypothetical protein